MEGHDGTFVVFEGIDGSGTTTQIHRYAARLKGQKRMVHVTREPSSGPVGNMLRLALSHRLVLPSTFEAQTMALLFAADRLDHLAAEVEPLLRDGAVVLSDRYDLSSLAYQSASAANTDPATTIAWIRDLNKHARRPDVTVVLDVSPEVAEARRRARGGSAELYDDEGLQARLARAYRDAEALVPDDVVIHIDGDKPADEVEAAIIEALLPFVERSASTPPPRSARKGAGPPLPGRSGR
jgi:dTMP kinase